jgi:hypothetical protein
VVGVAEYPELSTAVHYLVEENAHDIEDGHRFRSVRDDDLEVFITRLSVTMNSCRRSI